jgi:hypothetical protein
VKKDFSTTCGSGNRKKRTTPPPKSSIDSTITKNFTQNDISRYMKAWEVPVGASSKSQSTRIQERRRRAAISIMLQGKEEMEASTILETERS